jgi:hypothetical protein
LEADLELAVANDMASAVELLETGQFSGVITDGLEGGWRRVVDVAHSVGAKAVLYSGNIGYLQEAVGMGIEAHDKQNFDQAYVRGMVQTFLPENKTITGSQ